jgi:hypothetical protein
VEWLCPRSETVSRRTIAQTELLDPQGSLLSVEPFRRRALLVELLVGRALAIELMTDACTNTARQHRRAATLAPVWIVDRARQAYGVREEERTDIATLFVLDQADRAGSVGQLRAHGQPGFAQR